jgi:hypothetical protein
MSWLKGHGLINKLGQIPGMDVDYLDGECSKSLREVASTEVSNRIGDIILDPMMNSQQRGYIITLKGVLGRFSHVEHRLL